MELKRIIKGVSILSAGFVLAACGNETATDDETNGQVDEDTEDVTDETGDGDTVELVIATWANEQEAREFEEILDRLNDSQDVYELDHMMIPQDYYTRVQTMIAGSQAPDLMWLAQEYIPAYASNGAVLNLSDRLENQDEIDMDDYLDGSLDTALYEDDVYGLPWIGQPYVVYYNKTMFEEQGLEEPTLDWTWEDFQQVAREATVDNTYGFATTGNPPLGVFVWGEGGEIVESDGAVRVNEPESIQGLELAYDISNDESMTMPFQQASSMGVEQAFISERIAMMVGGANDDVERKVEEAGDQFEVGMAVMPAGSQEHVTFNWTASTLISDQTENEDVAFQALLDLTNEMFEWKVPSPMGSMVENIGEVNPYKEYALDVIIQSAEMSRGFNNLPEQNELGGAQWENLDLPILSNNEGAGGVDVEDLADDTAQRFEDIID